MTPESRGAAFNPMVRTEDNAPDPDQGAEQETTTEADDGQVTREDQG